ncbi:MAG TPA: DUF302 domain-containing protein [Hyphomicrobiaceae bacterium]|nr:DUF302 domain-containing protein [Hyphomicrobiaceae bacterium]
MKLLAALTIAALGLSTAATSLRAEAPMTVVESKVPVKAAMDALAKAVEGRGIKVVARIDHAAGAKSAGMELRPTEMLMFGNPKLGTPIIAADPRMGIELPMRVVAWQDAAGKTWIGYTSPDVYKGRYGLKGVDDPLTAMAKALEGLVKGAASGQ